MKSATGAARFLSLACIVTIAAGVNSGSKRRLTKVARSFVRSLEFKYTLRVCNAYPFPSAFDAYMQNEAVKLNSAPMVYKSCADFTPHINAGDRVDFKVGNVHAGTFTIQDLPMNDAVLLMVIFRRDSDSAAVAFESHVFSNVAAPQVAVLDVYKGRGKSELRVDRILQADQIDDEFANASHSELLRFESVVAVDSGIYELALNGLDNKTKGQSELVALPRGAYVAIRCGMDADQGPAYPEDLIVFPHSDRAALGGGAQLRVSILVWTMLACLLHGRDAVPMP